MDNYKALLRIFGSDMYNESQTIESKSWVTIDNIHDACIKIGLSMDYPISYYKRAAQQLAINNYNAKIRHFKIEYQNKDDLINNELESIETIINNYKFNDEEKALIYEKLSGVPAYKSQFKRGKYKQILNNIKGVLTNANKNN